jgi:hypothetical protein
MKTKSIMVERVKSNRSESRVWRVYIPGRKKYEQHCKNVKSALHYMFLVKKQTGLPLDDNSYCRLMWESRK